jgi:CheY-like chemotaxis protein
MATILVVDDEPGIRSLVGVSLGFDGHVVVEAASGQEALDLVSACPPDVIVLDLMMPGVDGWDVLSVLKADDDELVRTIPVVLLTALGGPLDRARGGIEGAVCHLAKPVGDEELRGAIVAALAGPEPDQRRQARQRALEDLARAESGDEATTAPVRRLRLTGLEAPRDRRRAERGGGDLVARLGSLTGKQRELLDVVARARTVLEAADHLSTSRTNVYAGLRRVARRLDVASVPELLRLARAGKLAG